MKKIVFLAFIFGIGIFSSPAQDLDGAYLSQDKDTTKLWLFTDGYSALTQYQENQYIATKGGPFTYTNNELVVSLEFNDTEPQLVRTEETYQINLTQTGFTDQDGNTWVKQNHPQALDGAWTISGRKTDGKLVEINHTGTRKTVKLLTGGYFQWIAMDPASQKFYGTGGGLYTFSDGEYTESILFFSRDNSRAGAKLSFKGELIDGDWHHSGLSSKGDPIYEVWSREKN